MRNDKPAPEVVDAIRAVGGIVHGDGNIFFGNISQLEQFAAGRVAASTTPVSQPPERPTLREAADHFAEAGHEFWNACRRDAGGGAVRWLDMSDGTLIIFTRGEYRETLLAGVDAIPGETTVKFEDSGDEVDGMPAVIAAEKLPHSQAAEPAPPAETSQQVAQKADEEPMFWVRLCSDGSYEGPLHNDSIEAVRKSSGAWTPLYTTLQAPALTDAELLDAKRYRSIRSWCNALTPQMIDEQTDKAIDAAMACKGCSMSQINQEVRTSSYHDLHITTKEIPRISIFNLPFTVQITCTRVSGWELWSAEKLIAGEYDTVGLRLDVNGTVICDSLSKELSKKDAA